MSEFTFLPSFTTMHHPQPIAGPVPRSFPDCANAPASPLHTQAARARWVGLFVLLVLMVALLLPTPARASRVALVIGNAAYEGEGRLNNPINDARLIAATLRELKFDVVTPRNVAGNAVSKTWTARACNRPLSTLASVRKRPRSSLSTTPDTACAAPMGATTWCR